MERENNVVKIVRSGPRRLTELAMQKNKLVGDVVAATGAGHLPLDVVAGALLEAAECDSDSKLAAWASRGAAFFNGSDPFAV